LRVFFTVAQRASDDNSRFFVLQQFRNRAILAANQDGAFFAIRSCHVIRKVPGVDLRRALTMT
jgi:hypothetical protein